MKSFVLLLAAIWPMFFIILSAAQNVVLPQCAVTCLVTAITESPCTASNQTCICTDPSIAQKAPLCISQECTVKESLVAKNFTESTCNNPIRSRQKSYRVITNVLGSISAPLVAIRIASKIWIRSPLGYDDAAIAMAVATGIPSTVLTTYGLLSNGLGLDIWRVTPRQITDFVHTFFVMEIMYFVQLALVKLSLLCFYLRIFPGKGIRKLILGSIVFDVLFGLVFVLVALVQCQPIGYYWKNWDGEHQGQCFNINAMAFANAAISIVFDGWMLALPMSQIINLKMHWRKKAGVTAMLLVGTFVTIVSVLRLQALVQFANSQNPTFDNTATGQWSTIEINVGIICACMPSMRILFLNIFPGIRGGSQNSSRKYYQNEINRNNSRSIGGTPRADNAIKLQKSFTVKYGNERGQLENEDEDEINLVPLDDLEAGIKKLGSRFKEEDIS